jgi:hypothetical protein
MPRRALAILGVSAALAGVAVACPAAGAENAVGPDQAFVGRVNGSFGDAAVKVICAGPGARRGHPAPGQQLAVLSPPPPVAAGTVVSVGQTGTRGRAIIARFSDDASVATRFGHYFAEMAIPTSLSLPCGGEGRVVFRAVPSSVSARPSVVSVRYVNPAAAAVRGSVLFGPTCPVEHAPPDPTCAPRPGAAHIRLVRVDGTVAAAADAGSDGRFLIDVTPGTYTVSATPAGSGTIGRGCSATPAQVTVARGDVATVSVACDTGIR